MTVWIIFINIHHIFSVVISLVKHPTIIFYHYYCDEASDCLERFCAFNILFDNLKFSLVLFSLLPSI